MSELFDTLFGSAYGYRLGGTTAGALLPVERADDERRPDLGQAQGNGAESNVIGGGCGYSYLCGYGTRPPSSPASYLSCLLDPVLSAARMFALNPIRIGRAKLVKAREDAPDDWG